MRWFKKIFGALTRKERLAFVFASIGVVISLIIVLGIILSGASSAVPTAGGEYVEGVLGQPEYVNPVTASSPADLDIVKMVYSNLPKLADSITASPDLKTWDVRLKEGLTWQDGQQLTSDDVIFTVQSIQNPDAKSPLYQSWQGVTVNRVSELELQFTLTNPYAFFGDNLQNLYILPKHLFADTPPGNWHLSDYNLKPVGSGPYEFLSYGSTSNGFISSYSLKAWNGNGASPLIQNFDFKYFQDENTLVQNFNTGEIDGFGNASPADLSAITRPDDVVSWPMSRYYAVFFNQSVNLGLQDPAVREALSDSIDRNALVQNALGGYGTPDYGPVPQGAQYYVPPAASTSSSSSAESLLDAAGWKVTSGTSPSSTAAFRSKVIGGTTIPLVVNLTVPQIDFLSKTASYLQTTWQSIGVQVNILSDSSDDIVNKKIPNRSYEGLLFGNVLGPNSDLYSFWDSSQAFSPGLNLSIYQNAQVDKLIEAARSNPLSASTTDEMAQAQHAIENNYPAIFLYSPNYVYVTNKDLQGVTTTLLTDPSDRFNNVADWYLNTARILK